MHHTLRPPVRSCADYENGTVRRPYREMFKGLRRKPAPLPLHPCVAAYLKGRQAAPFIAARLRERGAPGILRDLLGVPDEQ